MEYSLDKKRTYLMKFHNMNTDYLMDILIKSSLMHELK